MTCFKFLSRKLLEANLQRQCARCVLYLFPYSNTFRLRVYHSTQAPREMVFERCRSIQQQLRLFKILHDELSVFRLGLVDTACLNIDHKR